MQLDGQGSVLSRDMPIPLLAFSIHHTGEYREWS